MPRTELSQSDAVLWRIEHDPRLRSTIVAVALLEQRPDWARLRSTMLEVSKVIPRFRQKVEQPWLRPGPPHWTDDPDFDIDYHLRRIRATAPANLRTVLDIAGPIAMDAFDRDRPLWEFTLVEGLQGGRAALIHKVHHSFTDGVGGVEMAKLFLDASPDGDEHRRLAEAIGTRAPRAGRSGLNRIASATRATLAPLTDPLDAVRTTTRTVRSVGKLLRPVRHPMSPVMVDRGTSRRLDAFDVPLEEFSAAAHAHDATLNDAFLAALAGAMRRYHEHHGCEQSHLRVTMPINLRSDDDDLGSNRFTPVRFALPLSQPEPGNRMREIGAITQRWRSEPSLPLTEMLAGGLNLLPAGATAAVFGGLLKAVDLVATNVPGISERSYLAGVAVTHEYAFAPVSGAAFSAALVSHVDRCCIGVNIDISAVRDPDVLVDCLRSGFDDVIAANDHHHHP